MTFSLFLSGSPIFLMTAFSLILAAPAAAREYEQTPVILEANRILSPDWIQGENYLVAENVLNDGLINTYHLSTDYGHLTVEGTAELMIRITELRALAVMEEMDQKGVFGDAVVAGVERPFQGAADLVGSPVETGRGIVKGTGRFLSNVGRSIVSDDPYQDNALKVSLGYDAAKRQFAYELGINPYSNYEPVISRLAEIARAAVAGGMAPRAVMGAIDNKAVAAMRISGVAAGMKQLVRDNPPGELQKINRAKLAQMSVSPELAQSFLDNHCYNPQEKTLLVDALERLRGVQGRDLFIRRADTAAQHSLALFYRLTAQMMAGYHAKVAPAARIRDINGLLHLQTKDGVLALIAPVDFIFWTEALEDKIELLEDAIQETGGAARKELWLSGRIDPGARSQFEARGWRVHPKRMPVLLDH